MVGTRPCFDVGAICHFCWKNICSGFLQTRSRWVKNGKTVGKPQVLPCCERFTSKINLHESSGKAQMFDFNSSYAIIHVFSAPHAFLFALISFDSLVMIHTYRIWELEIPAKCMWKDRVALFTLMKSWEKLRNGIAFSKNASWKNL